MEWNFKTFLTVGLIIVGAILLLLFIRYIISGPECKYDKVNGYYIPDRECTPGVFNNISETALCSPVYRTNTLIASDSVKNSVYDKYGIKARDRKKNYDLDYLVPPILGGITDESNLWPQPRDQIDAKNLIEVYIQTHLCEGNINLSDSIEIFTTANWTEFAKATEVQNG